MSTHRLAVTRNDPNAQCLFALGESPDADPLPHLGWDQGGHLHGQALHPTSEVCHDTFRTGWRGKLSVSLFYVLCGS